MDNSLMILWPLVMSLMVIVLLVMKRGIADPLTILVLYYFVFSFGTVINYLTGANIYFGIKVDYIAQASWIFLLAIFAISLPALVIKLDRESYIRAARVTSPLANILRPANLVMLFISLGLILNLLIAGGGGADKIRNINITGGSIHYIYLLVQVYLTTFFFNIGKSRSDKFFYIANFLSYISYCLLVGERDFIFTVLSIGLHWSLAQPVSNRQNWKIALGGILLSLVGTAIFFVRDSTQVFDSPLTAVLGQGSLLFVNTFTLHLLDAGQPYFWGMSYIYAFLNLFPRFIWTTGFNMPEWFRDQYAPGSSSGYGYGLDAEGFINFSWPGVFVTFLAIGLFQRIIFNLKKARDFVIYYSVFNLAFTMYAIRNDSTAFLKGHFYALISYAALYFLSSLIPRLSHPKESL